MAPPPSALSNGSVTGGRLASVYSQVQTSRVDHDLPLPSVLNGPFTILDGPPSSAAGNPGSFPPFTSTLISSSTSLSRSMFVCFHADEIAKLFPHVFGQPSASLAPSDSHALQSDRELKIGVVLSGGQAPGGHNVISGIYGNNALVPFNPLSLLLSLFNYFCCFRLRLPATTRHWKHIVWFQGWSCRNHEGKIRWPHRWIYLSLQESGSHQFLFCTCFAEFCNFCWFR